MIPPLNRRNLLRLGGLSLAAACLSPRTAGAATAPRFLLQWGKRGKAEGEFDAAISIALDRDEHVYVTDFKNQRVQKFGSDGRFLAAFPVQVQPGGLVVDREGWIYVAHWSQHKIAVYSPTGALVREWGTKGTGEGQFQQPGGMVFGTDGGLYVADQGNSRVQKFTAEGQFLFQWGSLGSGPGQFGLGRMPGSRFAGPQFLARDRKGNVYATDTASGQVHKFTADGKHLLSWGSNDPGPGGFGSKTPVPIQGPIALCVDHRDCIWVGATNSRVQQFDSNGKFLQTLGVEGAEPGQFHVPHGLVADSRGALYVVDTENSRIQKFALDE